MHLRLFLFALIAGLMGMLWATSCVMWRAAEIGELAVAQQAVLAP